MFSPFLTITRELRDLVIDLVLTSHRHVPRHLNDELAGSRILYHIVEFPPTINARVNVKALTFEAGLPTSNALGLMLTNCQLFKETSAARDRLFAKEKVFKMDFMLAHERELWLTWVNVPAFSKDVDRLEIDVRIIGHMDRFGDGYTDKSLIWKSEFNLPQAIEWPLHALFDHVLEYGPQVPAGTVKKWTTGCGLKEKGFLVRNLLLNVTSTTGGAELARPVDRCAWWLSREQDQPTHTNTPELEHLQRKVMRPEWLAILFLVFLERHLSFEAGIPDYGSRLYQWIGSVDIQVGGKLMRHIDLGEKLATTNPHEGVHQREREAWVREWKANMFARRKEHGLSRGRKAGES